MPKVSIILPVYNAESTLERCIDSILRQTYQDYEIIAINDGSTDQSLTILEKYAKRLKGKFRVINQKNQGVSKTRNNAIKIATGKYITFIDNDDYLDSDYLENYVNAIERNNYDVVIGGYRRVNDAGKILETRYPRNNHWSKYTIISPWAKIYKKSFILEHKIEFLDYGIGEDIYFILQVYDKTTKIKTIDYVGYTWFYNIKSVSNTAHKGFNKHIDILHLIKKLKQKINGKGQMSTSDFDYYCIRLILWYLLYSGRMAKSEDFAMQYNYLFGYLKTNHKGYRRTILFNTPSGEDRNVRTIMRIIMLIDGLRLMKLFSKIYCKG